MPNPKPWLSGSFVRLLKIFLAFPCSCCNISARPTISFRNSYLVFGTSQLAEQGVHHDESGSCDRTSGGEGLGSQHWLQDFGKGNPKTPGPEDKGPKEPDPKTPDAKVLEVKVPATEAADPGAAKAGV